MSDTLPVALSTVRFLVTECALLDVRLGAELGAIPEIAEPVSDPVSEPLRLPPEPVLIHGSKARMWSRVGGGGALLELNGDIMVRLRRLFWAASMPTTRAAAMARPPTTITAITTALMLSSSSPPPLVLFRIVPLARGLEISQWSPSKPWTQSQPGCLFVYKIEGQGEFVAMNETLFSSENTRFTYSSSSKTRPRHRPLLTQKASLLKSPRSGFF